MTLGLSRAEMEEIGAREVKLAFEKLSSNVPTENPMDHVRMLVQAVSDAHFYALEANNQRIEEQLRAKGVLP